MKGSSIPEKGCNLPMWFPIQDSFRFVPWLTLSNGNKAIILERLRSLYEGFRPFFILRHPTKTEVGFKDGSIIVIIDNHYQL